MAGSRLESHPESHFRVPAIVNALEEMKLISKFRGSEVIKLQNFEPASIDDIASVHARAYISGLEKVKEQASKKGLILIEGSGPTYATATEGSYPGTGKFREVGTGNGEGTTLNLPLPGGSGDAAIRAVYDGHVLDPLANLQYTTGTYYMLASSIKQLAKDLCNIDNCSSIVYDCWGYMMPCMHIDHTKSL
ncbi:hypothetical protein RIF29_37841 [Crotalaria pallida]|uniref:Histone deacetylase n=1 Tax=Crotalaria pallida TaxID=3830 RepID=A0AAN9E0K1_CROPI